MFRNQYSLQAEVATNGAHGRLGRLGGAQHLAAFQDHVNPNPHHAHHGSGGLKRQVKTKTGVVGAVAGNEIELTIQVEYRMMGRFAEANLACSVCGEI